MKENKIGIEEVTRKVHVFMSSVEGKVEIFFEKGNETVLRTQRNRDSDSLDRISGQFYSMVLRNKVECRPHLGRTLGYTIRPKRGE